MNLFRDGFDFEGALRKTAQQGYVFVADVVDPEALVAMTQEARGLDLAVGDHVANPIWPGTPREVRQMHARAYFAVGAPEVPLATAVSVALSALVEGLVAEFPELSGWAPTEAGYQLYRGPTDFISPHRDRRTDQRLAVTLTLDGAAVVRVLEPMGHPDDYRNLRVADEFDARAGTLMLLRAPGFAGGAQVIHEVLPPTSPRLILNLRTRPNVLPQPY